MLQYNFKDKYLNVNNQNLEEVFGTYFYSPYVTTTGGNGSRINPYKSSQLSIDTRNSFVFSNGIHRFGTITLSNTNATKYFNGQGAKNTTFTGILNHGTNSGQKSIYLYFKDLGVDDFSLIVGGSATYVLNLYLYFNNVCFNNPINYTGSNQIRFNIARCLLKSLANSGTAPYSLAYSNNNSFVGINATIGSIAGSLHTWEKCNLMVNQASLDTYKSNYYAFDNCNFRIGSETDYAPLTGTTAEELRDDFVARCTAAGLIVPPAFEDYGITLTLSRWIFTKNQIFEGITWKGSEINIFEIPRLKSFGYSASRGDKIVITTENNIPASFAPNNSRSTGLDFAQDSLSIDSSIDITKKYNLYTDSKIIWLGGKKKLTNIDIPNDLPYQYGVLIDSIPGLLCDTGQEVTVIEPNEFYYVRSKNVNEASVKYNNVIYSSALSTRNNIFKGVANFTSFSANTGEPVVYKINDVLNYNSIQLRIVNKIPEAEITSGSLQADYWYYVDYKNSNNVSGAIVYNGVSYGATDSFLAKSGISTYTAHSNLKLRRCWHKDFEFKTGITDEVFWQNEQKPLWIDVLPEDTRCLMLNNSEKTQEMQSSSGVYIASGHPDFYNSILGSSSIPIPAFPIKGAFMQIRIPLTTINPV